MLESLVSALAHFQCTRFRRTKSGIVKLYCGRHYQASVELHPNYWVRVDKY